MIAALDSSAPSEAIYDPQSNVSFCPMDSRRDVIPRSARDFGNS
jgi:hypothetical protein